MVERPDIVEFGLEVVPPAYTGRAAQVLEGVIGRTEVFERSELTFELTFNKTVESAEFVWTSNPQPDADGMKFEIAQEDRIPLELSDESTRGRLTIEAERSGPYAVILRDDRELESVPTIARDLVVVADAPPQAAWADLDPEQLVNIPPIEARPDDVVPLPVRGMDDVGVVDLSLHAEVIQRSEPLPPLAAASAEMGRTAVSYEFPLSLGRFELREGDLLSVRVRAVDGRPVPAPQEGWSPARLIRISKDADSAGLQALLKEQQELRQAIEEIRKDVQQDQQQARELEEQAAQKQEENRALRRQRRRRRSGAARAGRAAANRATRRRVRRSSVAKQHRRRHAEDRRRADRTGEGRPPAGPDGSHRPST